MLKLYKSKTFVRQHCKISSKSDDRVRVIRGHMMLYTLYAHFANGQHHVHWYPGVCKQIDSYILEQTHQAI